MGDGVIAWVETKKRGKKNKYNFFSTQPTLLDLVYKHALDIIKKEEKEKKEEEEGLAFNFYQAVPSTITVWLIDLIMKPPFSTISLLCGYPPDLSGFFIQQKRSGERERGIRYREEVISTVTSSHRSSGSPVHPKVGGGGLDGDDISIAECSSSGLKKIQILSVSKMS